MTTNTPTTNNTQTTTVTFGNALVAGLIGGVIAAIVNVILYFVFQAINGGPLLVTRPGMAGPDALPLVAVLLLSLVPGLVAGIIYWVLARFTARPDRWFLIVAALVFIAFFFGPLGAASGIVTILALELMHVGAAVPIVMSLLRRT